MQPVYGRMRCDSTFKKRQGQRQARFTSVIWMPPIVQPTGEDQKKQRWKGKARLRGQPQHSKPVCFAFNLGGKIGKRCNRSHVSTVCPGTDQSPDTLFQGPTKDKSDTKVGSKPTQLVQLCEICADYATIQCHHGCGALLCRRLQCSARHAAAKHAPPRPPPPLPSRRTGITRLDEKGERERRGADKGTPHRD